MAHLSLVLHWPYRVHSVKSHHAEARAGRSVSQPAATMLGVMVVCLEHHRAWDFIGGVDRLLAISMSALPAWSVLGHCNTQALRLCLDWWWLRCRLWLQQSKYYGNINALSAHPSCMCFTPLNLRVTLIFMSKLVGACLLVDLAAFQPPPHTAANE